MIKYKKILGNVLRSIIVIITVIIVSIPFYFLVVNSFKPLKDLSANILSLPSPFSLNNYMRAWKRANFLQVFVNSLIVTIGSNFGVVILSSMTAYRLTRFPSRLNKTLYSIFIAEMIIPFQVIMIPLMVVAKNLRLTNSLFGLIIAYWGLGVAMGVFLFSGFIKSIPKELEEAAFIDGCSHLRIFYQIVFPLLKPITFTLIIINTFWFWNDFLLPMMFIGDPELRTIPIAIKSFIGMYFMQWDLALPSLVLAIIPAALAFFMMQKNIIKGLVAGAVKG